MAELILTEEEEALDSYLDLDDEALGKVVKHLAVEIVRFQEDEGYDGIIATTTATMLISKAIKANATGIDVNVGGLTLDGGKTNLGDWVVKVEKRSSAESTDGG